MAFKRKPAGSDAKPNVEAVGGRTGSRARKVRDFLVEVEGEVAYQLKRPVRVTFRLSEAEADRLRKLCFERRTSTQALLMELLAKEGVCDIET